MSFMEQRKNKIIVNKAGGTASKGSESFRISVPTVWVKALGLSKENRDIILSFDGEKIIVEKAEEEKMTEQKIEQAVRYAAASLAIEGLDCTDEEVNDAKKVLRGELTQEEAIQKIIDKCLKKEEMLHD